MARLDKLYAFVDTTVFLEYQEYTQLGWPNILKAKEVCLIVVPMVRKEIEGHRTDSRNQRRQKRARDVSGKLRELAFSVADGEEASVHGRPNVTYLEIAQSPCLNKYSKLAPETQDDHIIASILDFREQYPDRKILLVAGDTGLAFKARHFGLPQLYLPDNYRLEDEPTLEQRRVRELDRRVKILENPSPTLEINFKEALDRNITLPAEIPIDDFEHKQKLRVVSLVEKLERFKSEAEQSSSAQMAKYSGSERPFLFPLNFPPRIEKNLLALDTDISFDKSLLQPIRVAYERSSYDVLGTGPARLVGPDMPWYYTVQELDKMLGEVSRTIHDELRARQYKTLTLSVKNVGGITADELDVRIRTPTNSAALTKLLDTWHYGGFSYQGIDIPPSWRQGYLHLVDQIEVEIPAIKPGDVLVRRVGFVRVPEIANALQMDVEVFGRNLAAPIKDVFTVCSA